VNARYLRFVLQSCREEEEEEEEEQEEKEQEENKKKCIFVASIKYDMWHICIRTYGHLRMRKSRVLTRARTKIPRRVTLYY